MKKWWIVVPILLIAVFFAVGALLPSPDNLANKINIKTSTPGAYRMFCRQELWDSLSGNDFVITRRLLNSIELKTLSFSDSTRLQLLFVPLSNDSVQINWSANVPPASGVLARWKKYRTARELLRRIDESLSSFKLHLEKDENIYGIQIQQTSTTDTFLIAKKFQTNTYPSTREIYRQIATLERSAKIAGAIPSGFPMLNVTRTDSASYNCMTALPIDRIVPGTDSVFFVRMVPGRFLVTTITGGPWTIEHGHETLQQYFSDYKRTSMAIPFEYLVTNRLNESDTSRWVTRIYGPVY